MSVAERQRGSLLLRARLFSWLATNRSRLTRAGAAAPSVIAGFWPLDQEPDLLELYRQWHEQGMLIVLPVMQSDHSLHFHPWRPEMTMQQRRFGVREPELSQDTAPDVMLIPTLGFTTRGDRVGYGKGFYDRTLANLRKQQQQLMTIGVAWDCGNIDEISPSYQPANHDQPLDAIITPQAWHPAEPNYDRHNKLS